MKKFIQTLILVITIVNGQISIVNAQAPAAIPYQAVARNNSGNLIINQNIALRFSIHDGSATGTVVYKETKNTTTNAHGLFSVNIGQGTVVTGTFAAINWTTGAKFTQVEIDVTGGTSYVDIGTQQMLSVPYSLYAEKSGQWNTNLNDIYNSNTGKLGIGTTTPEFKLSLANDGGIIAKGTLSSGAILTTSGAGTRMIWYPKKGAFRAGTVIGTEWNDNNIGIYSTAMGYGTIASAEGSTAIGTTNTASGRFATAIGLSNIASGDGSTALGTGTLSSGNSSTALGSLTVASGSFSTAMGVYSIASGYYSTAIGFNTQANGFFSTAIGNSVSTNLMQGAFVLGDYGNSSIMYSSANDEFSARFAGGYRLFSNNALTTGVTLAAGGGSWTSVSDRNKKENFKPINSEDILQKIGDIPITNWNYKSQASAQRHIGCMAQDFYAAFHLDGESDTTINSLDIDGINMAAIQALKVRTDELKARTDELNNAVNEIASLKAEVTSMKGEWNEMKTMLVKNKNNSTEITTSTIK